MRRALLVLNEAPTSAMVVELRGPPGMRFSAAAVRKGRLGRFIAWKDLEKDQIELHFAVLLHRALLVLTEAPTSAMVVELR